MQWGIIPDMGGFTLWRGCVRDDILRELTYTARAFSGEEALAMGSRPCLMPTLLLAPARLLKPLPG